MDPHSHKAEPLRHEQADFSFDLVRDRKLLRIVFAGQWTLATVGRYRAARAEAIRSAAAGGISSNDLLMLVDRRSQPVQTQEVVDAIARVVVANGSLARRTAVLVTSALHARQIRRTAPVGEFSTFENEADALQWLQRPDQPR